MKYTMLPWMNPLSAGKIVIGAAAVLLFYNIFEYFLKKNNFSMSRGTLALISNTAWPLCLNFCAFTLFYWYWALPISMGISLLFVIIIRGELKTTREQELEGARGLNPHIRTLRSEAFADLSIEEQMEFKKNYRPHQFYWWLFLPLTIVLPFLAVLLLEQLGAGDYLFSIVYFE